jgi:hypothetical protein
MGWMAQGLNPGGVFSTPFQKGTGAHPALHWVLALFPEGVKQVGMLLTAHPF